VNDIAIMRTKSRREITPQVIKMSLRRYHETTRWWRRCLWHNVNL